MSQIASTLLLRNLHDVFDEINPVCRRAAIDEIFPWRRGVLRTERYLPAAAYGREARRPT